MQPQLSEIQCSCRGAELSSQHSHYTSIPHLLPASVGTCTRCTHPQCKHTHPYNWKKKRERQNPKSGEAAQQVGINNMRSKRSLCYADFSFLKSKLNYTLSRHMALYLSREMKTFFILAVRRCTENTHCESGVLKVIPRKTKPSKQNRPVIHIQAGRQLSVLSLYISPGFSQRVINTNHF